MLKFATLADILKHAAKVGVDNPPLAKVLHFVYGSWMDNFQQMSKSRGIALDKGYTTDPALFLNCLSGLIHVCETIEDINSMRDQFSQFNFTEMDRVFDDSEGIAENSNAAVFCLYVGEGGCFLSYVPQYLASQHQLFMVTLKEHENARKEACSIHRAMERS